MRRNAKAPFARTNRGQSPIGFGRIFGAAFSARTHSRNTNGSGAPPAQRRPLRHRAAGLLFFAALAVAFGVGVAPALADEAPKVRGLSAPSATVTEHTAMLKAEVNPGTGPSETEWEFEISDVGNEGPWTPIGGGGSLTADNTYHVVESEASGLTGNTRYWYRIVATNEAGGNTTTSSGFNSFTANGPRARALSVSNITEHTVLLEGEVNPGEPPEEANWHFEISSVGNEGPWTEVPGGGSLTADETYHEVDSEATGLAPETEYWYRLVAEKPESEPSTTSAGTFETAAPPTAATSPTFGPNGFAWHVWGSVNPHGSETHYFFEYGPTASYGGTAPIPAGEAGSGFKAVPVGADLFGLEFGHEYHFRLVAESTYGTDYGADQTLVVPLPPEEGGALCPNEALRVGPSAYLPDCRAYEMVSPPEKGGQQVLGTEALGLANPAVAEDGATAVFSTQGAFGESAGGGLLTTYLARRGGSNWSSESISPPLEPYGFIIASIFYGYTPTLETGLLFGGWNPPLTPGASEGTSNLYVRENNTGSYRLVSVGAPGNEGEIFFQGRAISDNGTHVVFSSPAELAGDCGPPAHAEYLCEWNAATGELSLVGRAPGTNEVLTEGTVNIAGPGFSGQTWRHPMSANGSRIFFSGGGSGCGVCVRINGATTQLVSETGTFQFASSDGAVAFVVNGGELERYKVNGDELTPLTAEGEVQGVLGGSTDGSRLYFVAKGKLAPGASAGEYNLYQWSEGSGIEFIATGTSSNIFKNNYSTNGAATSRVTPDGMHVAFQANNSLTGYADEGQSEAYIYSVATHELICASCNPSGEPATSGAFITDTSTELGNEPRSLSTNGNRLFFTTEESLVSRDTNSVEDTYEYDMASRRVALISSGTGELAAPFVDASANGNDVFFVTHRPLVGTDQNGVADLYDARAGGGLASQNPPEQPPPCTGGECRGESSTPTLTGANSSTFAGKGNLSSKRNCNKLGHEAKNLSHRAKRTRKNAGQAKRNGSSKHARQLNKKANRLAKHAKQKSKSAKKCRKSNRRASK